ncbi:MAG TPA: MgtC/SapB family protein [Bryobacteraceae bacterium]|nr:MgtC/SapB family protein [Bryobacteraceae bacterium]
MPFFDYGRAELIDIGKILAAYVLAVPVGWYREQEAHSVGVRTFPLVAAASCGFVLVAVPLGQSDLAAQSRVIQGLVAGIGFIGGGAILKTEGQNSYVHGTATAASIWSFGVVGAAIAQNRWLLAILLAALNFFALRFLYPLKVKLMARKERGDND